MSVEEQVRILAIQFAAEASAVIVVVPFIALHAGCVVPVHQRTEVVHNTNQLVFLACEVLELLQSDWSCHLFSVNYVPVSTVATMVESFEMDNQVLRQGIQRHCLIC